MASFRATSGERCWSRSTRGRTAGGGVRWRFWKPVVAQRIAAIAQQSATPTAVADQKSPAICTAVRTRDSVRTAAQWLAVAAASAGGVQGLGSCSARRRVPIANDPARRRADSSSAYSAADSARRAARKPSDALNLWVRDDAGQLHRVRVPLVDASTLDRAAGLEFQTGVPDDVRNRLQDRGYAVQSKRSTRRCGSKTAGR